MTRTTLEWFEIQYGDLDDYLGQWDINIEFEESEVSKEIEKSWRQIEQSYYEEFALESEEFDVYEQDEEEGMF